MEIERKFLVRELPDLTGLAVKMIWQGYLTAMSAPVEVRVRVTAGGPARVTAKESVQGKGAVRLEEEAEVPASLASMLQRACGSQHLEKARYLIPLGEQMAELDVYTKPAKFPNVVEVEFSDVESASAFVPPAWFGDEVTGDDTYANRHIAARSR